MYDKILVAVDHSEDIRPGPARGPRSGPAVQGRGLDPAPARARDITKTSVVMTDETEREATSMVEAAVDKLTEVA
jgi:hypothetical protein